MTWRASLFVVLAACAVTSSAAAQDATEQARRHFENGTRAFDTGDYELAVGEFRRAYELTQHPDLLFNIYSAAERAGHLDEAAQALERFLTDGEVEEERRPVLEQRLARLRERIAERESGAEEPQVVEEEPVEEEPALAEPEPEPPVAEPAPAAAPSWAPHPAGIATLVAAGVFAASFGVLAGLSEAEDQALARSCGRDAGRTCTADRLGTLEALNIAADASWIAAAALGVTGIVLLLALPAESAPSSVALAPWASPDGAGASIAGTF